MPRKVTPVTAIKKFFETPERPIEKGEVNALDPWEIEELAPQCAAALGLQLIQ